MFECNTILAESCVKRGAVVISAHHQHRRRRRMRRNVIRCILKNGRIQYDAVCNRAARSGLQLKKTSLGPFFRFTVVEDASLRDGGDSSQQQQQTSSSSFNKDSVGMEENTLGYCTGYMLPYLNLNSDTMPASNETSSSSSHADIVPTPPPPGKSILSKVVHLDAIEVRNTHKNSSVYGTSLTLGTAALVYAQEQGCTKARLLAIFDDYHTHKKLVKYYLRLGFHIVCQVQVDGDSTESDAGEDVNALRDLWEMMVWGGRGTLMEADVDTILDKWAPVYK